MSRSTAVSFLRPRGPRPLNHPPSARVTWFPRCLLLQTKFLGLQTPPPSDPQVLGLRPLLQDTHKWRFPAFTSKKIGLGVPALESVGGGPAPTLGDFRPASVSFAKPRPRRPRPRPSLPGGRATRTVESARGGAELLPGAPFSAPRLPLAPLRLLLRLASSSDARCSPAPRRLRLGGPGSGRRRGGARRRRRGGGSRLARAGRHLGSPASATSVLEV